MDTVFNLLVKMFDSSKVTPEGRDAAMELVMKNITYKTGLGWCQKFLDSDGETVNLFICLPSCSPSLLSFFVSEKTSNAVLLFGSC